MIQIKFIEHYVNWGALFLFFNLLFPETSVTGEPQTSLAWVWMIPAATAALGAVMGAAKNKREQQIEDADKKLAGETQRYSWVTGNQAGPIRRAGSAFGDIGSGALSGFSQGMNIGGAMGGGAGAMGAGVAEQKPTFDLWNKTASSQVGEDLGGGLGAVADLNEYEKRKRLLSSIGNS